MPLSSGTPESQRGKLLVEQNRAMGMVHDPSPAYRLRADLAAEERDRLRGAGPMSAWDRAEEEDYLQSITPGLEDAPRGALAALRARGTNP